MNCACPIGLVWWADQSLISANLTHEPPLKSKVPEASILPSARKGKGADFTRMAGEDGAKLVGGIIPKFE